MGQRLRRFRGRRSRTRNSAMLPPWSSVNNCTKGYPSLIAGAINLERAALSFQRAVYANAGFPLVIQFSVRLKSLSIQSVPKPSAVELFSIGLIARTCAFANVA